MKLIFYFDPLLETDVKYMVFAFRSYIDVKE